MITRFIAASALLSALLLPAFAGSFSINPVRLEMLPAQRATSMTISNSSSEPQLLQVSVYRWTRQDGKDVLSEVSGDEAPIVTPPLFKLAANGGSQVVRIGFRKAPGAQTDERSWRVIVEEVPKPSAPAAGAAPDTAVKGSPAAINLRLRISLPLIQRPAKVRQDLEWTLGSVGKGPLQLTAQNLGNVTERLDQIQLGPVDAKGDAGRLSGPFYIFPGERHVFELQAGAHFAPGPVTLSLQGTALPPVRELVIRAQ